MRIIVGVLVQLHIVPILKILLGSSLYEIMQIYIHIYLDCVMLHNIL